VEDAVRELTLALFCADTQPAELRAAARAGAALDGAAGALSAAPGRRGLARHRHPAVGGAAGPVLRRPQGAEIDLINQGIDYDVGGDDGAGPRGSVDVLTAVAAPSRAWATR
jgi:hypothetical protein